jgi:hypothetical protein
MTAVPVPLQRPGASSAVSIVPEPSTDSPHSAPKMKTSGVAPLEDITAEARRLLDAATAVQVTLRLLGGLAVAFRVPQGTSPLFSRAYRDIDFMAPKGTSGRQIAALLVDAGYTPHEQFNAINGHRRLIFHDPPNQRQIDIFIGAFAMCHEIPIGERLALEPDTIPLAELLLTKLQVMQINDKDLSDILALIYHNRLGDDDGREIINTRRIAALCAAEWGLWRTVTANLERADAALSHPGLGLVDTDRQVLAHRLQSLRARVDAEPKSRKWKLRARVGDRVRWYEDVEEVG